MTDNTPRPEPMSREQVLALIDGAMAPETVQKARAAVAALYERCEALERAVRSVHSLLDGADKWSSEDVRANANCAFSVTQDALYDTGTEASDAEGGG